MMMTEAHTIVSRKEHTASADMDQVEQLEEETIKKHIAAWALGNKDSRNHLVKHILQNPSLLDSGPLAGPQITSL